MKSKYPKDGLTIQQVNDEKKFVQQRKKKGIVQKCPLCNGEKFFITTMGLEVCSKDYYCVNIIKEV